MKENAALFLSALLALSSVPLRADEPAPAAEPPAPAAEAIAAETSAPAAEATAAETPAPAQAAAVDVQALQQGLHTLQGELFRARRALEKDERVIAIRALQKEALEKKDMEAARKHSAEARALVEKLLSEQPGMPEKLARILEVGNTLRSVLPAEQRRKGRRLPRAEIEPRENAEIEIPPAPSPEAPAEPAPAR